MKGGGVANRGFGEEVGWLREVLERRECGQSSLQGQVFYERWSFCIMGWEDMDHWMTTGEWLGLWEEFGS